MSTMALLPNFSITQRGSKNMIKNTNKNLNPIAIWRAAAPPRARIGKDAKGNFAQRALNRKKSSFAGFFTTEARPLVKTALVSRTPLNPIAPPPPPPPPIHTFT